MVRVLWIIVASFFYLFIAVIYYQCNLGFEIQCHLKFCELMPVVIL